MEGSEDLSYHGPFCLSAEKSSARAKQEIRSDLLDDAHEADKRERHTVL